MEQPREQRADRDIFNIDNKGNVTVINHSTVQRSRSESLLLQAVMEEVHLLLDQSLHNGVLINLGKQLQPQQVKCPRDADIKIGSKASESLPAETTILEVFDRPDIAGRLLILGEPGAGKTTTLLDLAKELCDRAKQDPTYFIPVLFNLSSWKDPKQTMTDWLVEELKSKYGVRKDIGKQWLMEKQLLPLLGELDEVKPEHQESCVQAINRWLEREDRPPYLAVCCRREEYETVVRGRWQEETDQQRDETRIQLNGAILLQTLTDEQIHGYLAAANQSELWQLLRQDEELRELVRTPLWLSIALLSYEGLSLNQWQQTTLTEQRLKLLLDAYVERMLHRELNSQTHGKYKPFTAKETRQWLIFLAQQLRRELSRDFLIEKIQPSYLSKDNELVIYFLADLSLNILAGHPGYDLDEKLSRILEFTPKRSLVYQLIISVSPDFLIDFIKIFNFLIQALIYYYKSHSNRYLRRRLADTLLTEINTSSLHKVVDQIEDLDSIQWSFNKSNFIVTLFIAPFLGAVLGLLLEKYSYFNAVCVCTFFGSLYGLIFGFHTALHANLITSDVNLRKFPNSAIINSLKNSLIISLLFGLAFYVLVGLITGFLTISVFHLENGLKIGIGIGLFVGLFDSLKIALDSGLKTVARHYLLRIILVQANCTPWNYARFLNYCTERHFLQRVGGRYRFIHKYLQEHFAEMGHGE